jgi:O-antigen ligase
LNPAIKTLFDRFIYFETSSSVLVRLERWRQTWTIFKENPIFGIGIGNLGYHLKHKITSIVSAHNLFLGSLAETGIIGFSLLLLLIISSSVLLVRNCIRIKMSFFNCFSWGIFAALIGVLVHSMVEPNLEGYQFSLIFWSLIGVSFSLDNLKTNRKI